MKQRNVTAPGLNLLINSLYFPVADALTDAMMLSCWDNIPMGSMLLARLITSLLSGQFLLIIAGEVEI